MTAHEAVRGRRPGTSWVRVSHGLYRPRASLSDMPAWQLVLPPSGRFTGLTAAELLGWSLPPLPQGLPVFASIAKSEVRRQRAGLAVFRQDDLADPVEVNGVLTDPPQDVLLACARHLELLDLVVLVDSALHRDDCSRDELAAAATRRRRGVPRLRATLEYADRRSESAWETLLRVMHMTCDIDVEPQLTLHDELGRVLGRADLWLRGTNALHEYDGQHHLSRQQQRVDLRRARRLVNDAWIRRGYTSADLLQQAVTILRDADLSLGREHRPARIRRWHGLLRDSLFSPSGQERIRQLLTLTGPASGATGRVRSA